MSDQRESQSAGDIIQIARPIRPKWGRAILALAVALVAAAFAYVKSHPLVFNESFFSHAHCIKLTGLGLSIYAVDNHGVFPSHSNGYGDALLMITNEVGLLDALGGPGYKDAVFRNAIIAGSDVDERFCGRVYVQGLRENMEPALAQFFDKLSTPGGDHCHLLRRLTAPLGREVWTLGGGNRFVTDSDWPKFASNQVNLLIQAGFQRADAERLYNEEMLPPPKIAR